MLWVRDGATMTRDDPKKPCSQLIDWYRDVTYRSRVD
jgi:hypothetical protein